MLGRRFLLLVAVMMGLTALAASVAPRQPVVRDGAPAGRTATPTPTPTVASGEPAPRTVERTISASEGTTRVAVDEGELLELTITGSELDSVSLLDEIEPITPEAPARFHLLADEPGQYPIELLDAERRIGTLVVRARQ
jgi:hypothetical protein